MPNTNNAKKALRKSLVRRLRNRSQRTSLRNALKVARTAAVAGDADAATTAFRFATKKLDQAAAKNLIHKNKAARLKSRLSKFMVKSAASA